MTDPAAAAAVVVAVSPWTPTAIGVLLGAVATLIGAMATLGKIFLEIRSTKTTVIENAAAGVKAGTERDQKLDRIEILVNGRYSQVLQELADMKRQWADYSQTAVTRAQAVVAQSVADEQHARVAAAGGAIPRKP